MRAFGIASAVLVALIACSGSARAVPVSIDLTISYTNPPNPGATGQLTGTVEFWQDVNDVFVNWGDSVPIGTLSLGDTFSTVLYPPNPCNGSSCELGVSFDGLIGGTITTYALAQALGPNDLFPGSPSIIPIATFFPPNPCTGTSCQASGPVVANDQPITVGTLDVTITQTPLPAALPLFATGLGALGLFGWRRKRKAQAVAA